MSENFFTTNTEVRVVITDAGRIDEEKGRTRTVPLRPILNRALDIADIAAVLVAVVVFLIPGGTVLAAVTAAVVTSGGGFVLNVFIGLVAWYVHHPSNPTPGRG
jgi:hypothetical protein